jgi:hypothetical protein
MKALKTCGKIALYPLMALLLFYQVMGIIGVSISTVPALVEATWLVPVWVVMMVLIALPLILYPWWKKQEILPLVMMGMSLVGAILALVIALTLQAALPVVVSSTSISATGEQGLDAIKLITRHYSPLVVGVVMAVIAFLRYKQNRDSRVREEEDSYTSQFVDEEFEYTTLGEYLAREGRKPGGKKLSKRQRKALREQEESGK